MSANRSPLLVSMLVALAALVAFDAALAQSLTYRRGQTVAPAYEGWEEDAAGKKYFLFGYMNRNWEEEVVVPVGAENFLSPGPQDQGQPTRFLPRRNRFVFRVPVPDGFSDTDEMIWTLTTRGETEKAYASLRIDYFVDDIVKASERGALGAGTSDPVVRSNQAPTLELEGRTELRAKVGEPITIVARAADDAIPAPKVRQAAAFFFATSDGGLPLEDTRPEWQPPLQVTVDAATGLWVSCFPYRGAGEVTFDPPQIKAWEDSRTGTNSPWAPTWTAPPPPADGKWVTRVTFAEPGEYRIRCQSNDGALTAERDVEITVSP